MLCISQTGTNPYFNIAADEYLFRTFDEDIFRIYINSPSVIIGKHQNPYKEINYPFIRQENIAVVRRISGGGAVYQDLGNVNFTFITTVKNEKPVNFRKYTLPVIKFLKKNGISASFEGKSNVTIDGLKISGNAEHVFKNRVLHHGTLLFSSRLKNLAKALTPSTLPYQTNAVQSIRSRVTNISQYIDSPMTINEFANAFFDSILSDFKGRGEYRFSEKDMAEINGLVREKYETWLWNFGYSPPYEVQTTINLADKAYSIYFFVKNGIIEKVEAKNYAGQRFLYLEKALIQCRHSFDDIKTGLQSLDDKFQMPEKQIHEITGRLF